MIYDATVTSTFQVYNTTWASGLMGQSPNNTSVNSKQSIEVIDFDGEYYTLNHTATMTLNQKTFSFSYLEKMNKTGYSTYIFNMGTQQITTNTSGSLNLYLTELLNKSEVKVGDTWRVPLPTDSSGIEMSGDLMMTFRGFEDLTVPAGTYKVFRVDVTSNNLSMHFNPSGSNLGINLANNIDIGMNGQIYVEYGTLRQIKSTMQEIVSYQSAIMNYTMNLSVEMTLVQHTKP
jgi:hypothetical protein